MNQPESLHVVLGSGQVGARLAALLSQQGKRVRVVRRTAAEVAPGLEAMHGDLTDLAFATRALAGAAVAYDCMNPPYHRWAEQLLPMARGALHGARVAGSKLVALDCLYMYGRPSGPMREDGAMAPCSKKGALRAALSELRRSAHARGEVEVAIARASDFFGADLTYSSFSDRFYTRALAGRPVECMGDPDMPHSYTYVPDVVRTLARLGDERAAFGEVWHVPSLPPLTTRELNARYGRVLGLDVRTARVPGLVLRALGLVSPLLREVREMVYQWEVPFVIDDAKIRAAFGIEATPLDEALRETADWARARYRLARAA